MIDPRFYELVSYLWRGGSYAYYWTPDTDSGKLSQWFDVDNVSVVPVVWSKVNCYFSVHPLKMRKDKFSRGLIRDVQAVNCLYAEFDIDDITRKDFVLQSIQTMDTPPSVIVFSGGGYHCYWLLDSTFVVNTDEDLEHIKTVQYAWNDYVSGSDIAVKDLARVLRIPGTHNRKPEYHPYYPEVQFVQCDLECTYALETLEIQVDPQIQKFAAKAKQTISNPSVVHIDVDDIELITRMRQNPDYDALWRGEMSKYNDDHSSADMALCSELAYWFGRDASRIDSAFRQSGLMRDKWNRDDYRERTLDRAITGCKNTYTPGADRGGADDLVGVASKVTFASVNGTAASNQSTVQTNSRPANQQQKSAPNPAPQPTSQQSSTNLYFGFPTVEDALLGLEANDAGNGECVVMLYGSQFLYCAAYGFLYFNGKFWEQSGASEKLIQSTVEVLRRRQGLAKANKNESIERAAKPSAATVRAAMYFIQTLLVVDISQFDNEPDKLNCNNGVVDLKTGFLYPHDSSQKFTYCVPIDYKSNADYVDWLNFLNSSTTEIDYVQKAVGYSLTGRTQEECLFYVWGPSRSGKGTFTEAILEMLGKPLAIQADFKTFTADRVGDTQNFDLAPLKPSRFVVASESDRYEKINEAKIKSITGGDSIRCAFKHKDHFEFRPQFKIWLISNHPIKGDVDDEAFWGRLRIIEFPNSRLGQEDKTLKERMKSKESLQGILTWAVQGAIEWYRLSEGLKTPDSIRKNVMNRRIELDHITQWIDSCCAVDATAWHTNSSVYYSYTEWCRSNGINHPKSLDVLCQSLAKRGYKTSIQRRTANGARPRGVEGLKIL